MTRWTAEKANDWYQQQPWIVGCNFLPSTAINQLEMWQAESFDAETLTRELGWAADLGMNSVRVYLHDLLWQDAAGFKDRMNRFLDIASTHGIRPLFTIFDDCWNDDPALGKQPAPRPGIHNSGWVQSPGRNVVSDSSQWGRLKDYVQGLFQAFGNDPRILMWDLYNEVGNDGAPGLKGNPAASRELLKQTFAWAREVGSSQPLSSSIWNSDDILNAYLPEACDVNTFHNYNDAANLQAQITALKAYGRPLICTEYMARTRGSLFATHLPIFKRENVGCYNWGFVAGKSNTIYAWGTPLPGAEPPLWFHDILRPDGTPYKQDEVDVFHSLKS